jgi:hypothetical protein
VAEVLGQSASAMPLRSCDLVGHVGRREFRELRREVTGLLVAAHLQHLLLHRRDLLLQERLRAAAAPAPLICSDSRAAIGSGILETGLRLIQPRQVELVALLLLALLLALLLRERGERLPEILLAGGDLADLIDHPGQVRALALALRLAVAGVAVAGGAGVAARLSWCAHAAAPTSCLACWVARSRSATLTIASAACHIARSPARLPCRLA